MNYYNPYFYTMPMQTTRNIGLFSRLLGGSGITFKGILSGTERALNFANQAIPLVKEVRPMIGNAKTVFKVMNEFKKVEKPISTSNNVTNNSSINEVNEAIENNGPTFFA